MADDIKEQMTKRNHTSTFFSIQLGESTNGAQWSSQDMFKGILLMKSSLSCIGGYDKNIRRYGLYFQFH